MKSDFIEPLYGDLPHTSIGELVKQRIADLQTGPFGTMLHASSYVSSGTPVVAVKDIGDNRLKHDGLVYINETDAKRLDKYSIKSGDILFSRKGAVTRRAYVTEREKGWIQGSDCIRLRLDGTKFDSRFVSYLLGTEAHAEWISRNAQGATMPSLNQEILYRVPFPNLPLAEQKTIADILEDFDYKIEVNRQMNETLEAIARALFKSWFIDFDPVHAKVQGELPVGMDEETAVLFPDTFTETEHGLIPAGWQLGKVADSFKITMGQSPPGYTYNESGKGLPFYQGRTDFGFRYPELRIFCTEPKRFAKKADTLVSVRAPVGDINMALRDCCIGRGVAAVRHKTGSRSYTYYAMQSLATYFTRFEGEGTVFGSLSKRDFHNLPFVLPNTKIVQVFEQLAFPLDEQIELNEQLSQTLTELRDTLLPRLISGQIQLRQGEPRA